MVGAAVAGVGERPPDQATMVPLPGSEPYEGTVDDLLDWADMVPDGPETQSFPPPTTEGSQDARHIAEAFALSEDGEPQRPKRPLPITPNMRQDLDIYMGPPAAPSASRLVDRWGGAVEYEPVVKRNRDRGFFPPEPGFM